MAVGRVGSRSADFFSKRLSLSHFSFIFSKFLFFSCFLVLVARVRFHRFDRFKNTNTTPHYFYRIYLPTPYYLRLSDPYSVPPTT